MRENLALSGLLHGLRRVKASARAGELIGALSLEQMADQRARSLSGGLRRRVDLAQAMVHRPSVLFLDEPTTGLDLQSRTALWGLLRDLIRICACIKHGLIGTGNALGALAWSRATEAARLCPGPAGAVRCDANQTTANAVDGPEESRRVRRAGMGKATRIKQQSAREKIAAQRAAARRAEVRNRLLIAGGSVVAVLAIVLALVLVKAFNKPGSGGSGSGSGGVTGTALSASAARDVTSVPVSTLNTVGAGSVPHYNPQAITPISGSPPLTSNGKPEMLYIGAEFCPYCAAERWSMAIALSRFGTLSPLRGIHSSSSDADPNTPTLTFYRSTYSSPYLVFTPVENETITRTLLQTPTAPEQALWAKYDTSNGYQGYPFIDFGNKYVIKLPSFDPGVLAHMTWSQVAAALHNPSSPVAQGADGAANLITAAICKMTNGQPGSVCTAPGVVTASKSL